MPSEPRADIGGTLKTTGPTEDTFHAYLYRPDANNGTASRVEKLYECCHSPNLSSLLSDADADVSWPLNIVYHDNCFKHGVRCCSKTLGPLNARDIYHKLIEIVSH